jgi:hypothetical protein
MGKIRINKKAAQMCMIILGSVVPFASLTAVAVLMAVDEGAPHSLAIAWAVPGMLIWVWTMFRMERWSAENSSGDGLSIMVISFVAGVVWPLTLAIFAISWACRRVVRLVTLMMALPNRTTWVRGTGTECVTMAEPGTALDLRTWVLS